MTMKKITVRPSKSPKLRVRAAKPSQPWAAKYTVPQNVKLASGLSEEALKAFELSKLIKDA